MKSTVAFLLILTFLFGCNNSKKQLITWQVKDTLNPYPVKNNMLFTSEEPKRKANSRIFSDSLHIIVSNKSYRKVSKSDSISAATYYNKGNDYLDDKKYKLAISFFTKAIEAKPIYAEAYFERGNAKYELHLINGKDYSISFYDDWSKAIEINPNYGEAYFQRGMYLNMACNEIPATCGNEDISKARSLGYNLDLFH